MHTTTPGLTALIKRSEKVFSYCFRTMFVVSRDTKIVSARIKSENLESENKLDVSKKEKDHGHM